MRRWLVVLSLFIAPALFAQSADQAILSITDSPDPVVPGNNVTYTIQIQNNGPDAATNGGVNLSFPSMNWVSGTGPAGFTCSVLGNNASCVNPSWAPGTATITVVLQMPPHLISFADGSTSLSVTTSGTTPDPVAGNNSDSETTSWDSPQIDIVTTASDSPDPVAPDGDITYTVNIVNNGPDAGTNAQFSTFNNNSLRFRSAIVPAGWTCTLPAVDGNPTFSCTKPTIASGETAQFTVVVRAYQSVLGSSDGSVQMSFNANATGHETAPGNNIEEETTGYVAPDADLVVTLTDSPDPVTPDNNITYTATVTNNGPDTATNVSASFFNAQGLQFQSITTPAGWTCTPPGVNGAINFSCTIPSFANGATSTFTLVARAPRDVIGANDTTIQTQFSAFSSIVADPAGANNTDTESTAYVTPDADLAVTATDSPDPVAPDGDITYTATVTNNGPDTATGVTLSIYNSEGLRFQSLSVPAGWTCSTPAVNATANFNCTNASFASGASSTFTMVLRAPSDVLGINDRTLTTGFLVTSNTVADPVGGNNVDNETTAYVTPDADLQITASDSPDPVANGNNVTFTVTATNAGPDAAPNTMVTLSPHPSLTFQSVSAPAGWTCTTPAVDTAGVVQCTNASLASGGSATFTLVTKVVASGSGGTLNSNFTVSSNVQDPNNVNNSAGVSTTWVGATSDLSINKSTLQTAAAQGSMITYTISSSNAGPDAASNVTITDVLPAQLRFESINAPAGWNCTTPAAGTNGTITCTIASMPVGSANFTLVATVAPDATGSITNTATIGGSGTDPNPGNGSGSSPATAVAGNADLGVTKTTTASNVAPGGAISYTINVTNNGPDAAASAVMTDTLPASLLFQSISAPAGWTCTTPAVGATGTITCNAATLASGATATFTLNVTVANSASGSVTNTANASHSGTDGNGGNNGGSSPAVTITPSADLSITKTTTTTSITPGQSYSYTINVVNGGPGSATSVTMTDVLPAALQFVSVSAPAGWTCTTPAVNANGTVTCTTATMNTGTATFTLTVRVDPSASGSITNTATVSATSSDPDSGDTTSTTTPLVITTQSADVSVTKTTTAGTLTPGQTFSYTISVANAGPDAAANVVMNDVLPASLLFQSLSAPAGWTCTTPAAGTNGTVNCTRPSLASGTTANFTLTVRVANSATGTIVNSATVTSATTDPDGGDNTATTPPNAVGPASADVSVVKSNGSSVAVTGAPFSYTINVANAGPSVATNVVVTDVIPAGLAFVNANASQGSCTGTTTITCNLGTLNSGASASITINTTVTATSGTVTNTAVVTSSTADPNGGNNTSTTPSVPVTATAVSEIPTLSEWALIGLAMLLGIAAVVRVRM